MAAANTHTRGVTIVGNWHGDVSSNPGQRSLNST